MIYQKSEVEFDCYVEAVKEMNSGKTRYCHVMTFGCQQNEADSEHIVGILESMGYTYTEDVDLCEIVIFNTCAVREHAEKKALSIVGRLKAKKAENPDLLIGITGCMAAEGETVEKIKKSYHFVSFTLEPNMLHRIPAIIYSLKTERKRKFLLGEDKGDIVEGLPTVRRQAHRAWVSIMYGCNNFCSYCIVPYTRGRERSRNSSDVLAECRNLVSSGVKEITLLGQNVNSYRSDIDFAELLSKIAEIKGDFLIRFMTSHPKDVPDELISVMAKYREKIAPFFHLPLQSGSDKVLLAMNRRYDTKRYLGIIDKLRDAISDIAFSTDIIVGFPGESDEDFADTMNILRTVGYDNVYSFIYSKRIGTPAATMENEVPKTTVDERMAILLSECKEMAFVKNKEYEGKTVRVLVDGLSKKGNIDVYSARTASNKLVHIHSDENLIGKFVYVKIEKAKPFDLVGVLIN